MNLDNNLHSSRMDFQSSYLSINSSQNFVMNQETADEIAVMESIYGINITTEPLAFESQYGEFQLKFEFSNDYPQTKPPGFTISHPILYKKNEQVDWERQLYKEVQGHFDEMFVPGEVVIYQWIEWFTEYLRNLKLDVEAIENQEGSIEESSESYNVSTGAHEQFTYDGDGYAIIEGCPVIYHSVEPLIERKSVFVAHLAKVETLKQIKLVRKTLMSNKQVSKATHNIAAYRIVEENGVIRQDGDDDGETAAGSRLLHLLQLADVKDVYVIVSRWLLFLIRYGGVQLGPARFKCINNCARLLLLEHNFITK